MLSVSLSRVHSILRRAAARQPTLVHSVTWTLLLTMTVAVGSFAPEAAFISSISRSSSSSPYVKVPLDSVPVSLPAHLIGRSQFDFVVPTVCLALVVLASACAIQSSALLDDFRSS